MPGFQIQGNLQGSQHIRFDLAWTCPTQCQPDGRVASPIRLLVDNLSNSQTITISRPSVPDSRHRLEMALETRLRTEGGPSNSNEAAAQPVPRSSLIAPNENIAPTVPLNLREIPNLCRHLGQQRQDTLVGFLENARQVRHLFHTDCGPLPSNSNIITLANHLKTLRANDIGLPDVELATLLALAVPRFHSTPWLQNQRQSQDVVFFGIVDSLGMQYLKSRVQSRTSFMNPILAPAQTTVAGCGTVSPAATSRTLYSLGVVLVELVYKARLEDLRVEADGPEENPRSLHQTAVRLGGRIWREMGPDYAHAVSMCLHEGFGDSAEIENIDVQKAFFDHVAQKLEKSAKGIRSF